MGPLGAPGWILDAIVTSGRPPTPLDASRWGQPLFSKVLAESGGEELLILQIKPIGTERVPKGNQKSTKERPKYINKLGAKKGGA